MARYIDADKLQHEIDKWLDSVGNVLVGKGLSYYGELMGCIEDTPTEDVVPVVRCKDCKRYIKGSAGEHSNYCDCHSATWEKFFCLPNDYCSYGERKDNNGK